MPRKKKDKPKEFLVKMKITMMETWLVEASDEEDAMAKANAGKGDEYSVDETIDWQAVSAELCR